MIMTMMMIKWYEKGKFRYSNVVSLHDSLHCNIFVYFCIEIETCIFSICIRCVVDNKIDTKYSYGYLNIIKSLLDYLFSYIESRC